MKGKDKTETIAKVFTKIPFGTAVVLLLLFLCVKFIKSCIILFLVGVIFAPIPCLVMSVLGLVASVLGRIKGDYNMIAYIILGIINVLLFSYGAYAISTFRFSIC
ncbi:MAG: hypothetical protein J5582_10615 [Ruminococcus sp.]|uniref:Uncharacterized protein n=1 Tax=Ruminococcus albus TaxID=1264 RepID=A0A1H7K846_RUMAL|nr:MULTISPECIES: hypothetical protein [Ruminococcus]MBO4866992.1 hypothetical protein [Ruminococcus sp.]SEK82714.1 hypothetical protein SAMN05216469_10697 [Ruminococcus albus]